MSEQNNIIDKLVELLLADTYKEEVAWEAVAEREYKAPYRGAVVVYSANVSVNVFAIRVFDAKGVERYVQQVGGWDHQTYDLLWRAARKHVEATYGRGDEGFILQMINGSVREGPRINHNFYSGGLLCQIATEDGEPWRGYVRLPAGHPWIGEEEAGDLLLDIGGDLDCEITWSGPRADYGDAWWIGFHGIAEEHDARILVVDLVRLVLAAEGK